MKDAGGERPTTIKPNLAKPPKALAALLARPQFCVWNYQQKANGSWQKPPFVAAAPDQYASSTDPATWCDYATALAVVQARRAKGATYILTPDDPFGAADLDHCRNLATGAIADWAQQWLDQAAAIPTYVEITPSGTGLRIWGTISADTQLHSNDQIDEHGARIELFRRTRKPLTVTGLQIGNCTSFGNIDALLDRAAAWAKQHKPAKPAKSNINNFSAGTLGQLNIDQIEQIVQEGAPPEGNRSDLFHAIVGHYFACGWSGDQIAEHLEQFPNGIGDRYLAEERLRGEINRSLFKWERVRGTQQQQFDPGTWSSAWQKKPEEPPWPEETPDPEQAPPWQEEAPAPETEPEEEPEEEERPQFELPPMYCHGDPDPRPITSWLIKNLLASVSFGILSGQWGTGKTFLVFELSACLMTNQPFIGHAIKKQCGVMYIAAEGASEVRRRRR
jgi:hypothetical protein